MSRTVMSKATPTSGIKLKPTKDDLDSATLRLLKFYRHAGDKESALRIFKILGLPMKYYEFVCNLAEEFERGK